MRLHVQQPSVDFFKRVNLMHHMRCELNSRPSVPVVEFVVRPKVTREAARSAHSLPTFATWLHKWWLLLVLGLKRSSLHAKQQRDFWQRFSCQTGPDTKNSDFDLVVAKRNGVLVREMTSVVNDKPKKTP